MSDMLLAPWFLWIVHNVQLLCHDLHETKMRQYNCLIVKAVNRQSTSESFANSGRIIDDVAAIWRIWQQPGGAEQDDQGICSEGAHSQLQ